MDGESSALYELLLKDLSDYGYHGHQPDYGNSPRLFAAHSLSRSLFKKFEDVSPEAADRAALEKFKLVNDRCGRYRLPTQRNTWDDEFIGNLKEFLYRFFYPTSVGCLIQLSAIEDRVAAGPGVSIGARGEDFYTKHFDSTLTCTSESRFLRSVYTRFCGRSELWSKAEEFRDKTYGFTTVSGSKLSFAPKNVDISRTICVEPSLNMFYQLGLGSLLTERLRHFGVDTSKQPEVNKLLCCEGSVDGSFGTIDLSSASDSLANTLLAELLPQEVFTWLWALRSHRVVLPDKTMCELHMISTMGNGFTFPLQTILFAGVVIATYQQLGIPIKKRCDGAGDNYGVFGDDIIVRREAYNRVVLNLELLGFVVNRDKSFNEGSFRESCGVDYFAGSDIRGIYCKTLRSVGSRFSLINRLVRWSALHSIKVERTLARLCRSVPIVMVPFLDSDDAGIKVPFEALPMSVKRRATKGPIAYQRWAPNAPKIRFTGDALSTPKGCKPRGFNEYGLAVCLLHGSFSENVITLRNKRGSRYFRVRGCVAAWDSTSHVNMDFHPRPWRGLSHFVVTSIRSLPALLPGEWPRWSSAVVSILRGIGSMG